MATATQGTRFMVQWEEHPMHLATRLGYLLEHQSLVDVTLMCNTHTLKVHRSVLAACSPYFESVLQRQLGNHPLIVLKDMKFCVLKSLIEFMYCGETSVTEENLNPLMEAAKFFEVKGLCTMSKEVLGGERPIPIKGNTNPVNGTTNSIADITPTTTYRGRGRRPGVGRGRKNLSTMLMPPSQGVPQAETAQIMLSLSGNTSGPTFQTTSRNVRISPNSHLGRTLHSGSNILDSSKLMHNGTLCTTDLKALREQLNLEPRKRGRRRQNFGLGRGRIKDLVESKFGIQTIKKETDNIQQKEGILFKPLESKLNLFNNNGNNDAKSPLLASLLSKAEALAKAKVKTENDGEDGQTTEQETVLYQFDGESSGATKYLDALKEAGLPTDVPVLIDNGDGNYVTLTEDVLMNVLGNNEEFQFQVTEATLEQGDVSEGVVMQDGTIMMTGKNGKSDLTGPLLTVGKRPITIKSVKEVKGKRGPKPRQLLKEIPNAKLAENDVSPDKSTKNEPGSKKSVQELINEAVLESLKNGAACEAEADPDAVVLYEVTDNDKVSKFVVSSKEVSALKALNEQIEKQKKKNSPGEKKSPLPTVIDGNTNIAEIKLTVSKNSRKSIVSEVLARAHSLENQVKNCITNEPLQNNDEIKNDVSSPQMLGINLATDVLNDSSQLMRMTPARDNLENPNMIDLSEESEILDEDNNMVVLRDESHIIQVNGQHETVNISGGNNLMVVNNSDLILEQERIDLAEEPSEDSQFIQINECSQDLGEDSQALHICAQESLEDSQPLNICPQEAVEDSQALHMCTQELDEREETTEEINVEGSERTIHPTSRDMPLLENEAQLVELEFIDGNGEKIEGYRVEGTVLSQKEISELSGLSHQSKDSDVIGLLDMVCEEAATQDNINNEVLNYVSTVKGNVPSTDTIKVNVTSGDNSINHSQYSVVQVTKGFTTEHLMLEKVQNMDARHLESADMSLDEGECQEISVEQALQAMMGDENSEGVESREFNQEIKQSENQSQQDSSLQHLRHQSKSKNNIENSNNFQFVYVENENPPKEIVKVIPAESHILPEESTNKILTNLEPVNPEEIMNEECIETTIVTPTKDVPFAVGLVPLKDALVQIQSIPDRQPRKTRSGSTSRSESNGAKRRSSIENCVDGPVKRRKSVEEEESSSCKVVDEECVTITT